MSDYRLDHYYSGSVFRDGLVKVKEELAEVIHGVISALLSKREEESKHFSYRNINSWIGDLFGDLGKSPSSALVIHMIALAFPADKADEYNIDPVGLFKNLLTKMTDLLIEFPGALKILVRAEKLARGEVLIESSIERYKMLSPIKILELDKELTLHFAFQLLKVCQNLSEIDLHQGRSRFGVTELEDITKAKVKILELIEKFIEEDIPDYSSEIHENFFSQLVELGLVIVRFQDGKKTLDLYRKVLKTMARKTPEEISVNVFRSLTQAGEDSTGARKEIATTIAMALHQRLDPIETLKTVLTVRKKG